MPIRPKTEDWSDETREGALELPDDIGEVDPDDPAEDVPTTEPVPQDKPDTEDGQ